MAIMQMKRHEMWRQQYRTQRYMNHLNYNELQQRAKDIIGNYLVLSNKGKISLLELCNNGGYWIELFTHILEEFQLRFGPYPAGFPKDFMQKVRVPNLKHPLTAKAIKAIKKHKLQSCSYLFKYGQYSHLSDALKHGKIRISPASSVNDPTLNLAINDNELQLTIQPNPSNIRLTLKPKNGQTKELKNIHKFTFTEHSKTDYYFYCLSSFLSPQLFLDFGYNACLCIKDPKRFLKSILSNFKNSFPQWQNRNTQVSYIDPLKTPINNIDVFFSKHFRYAYQKEYRIVWLPPAPIKQLDYIFVEMENLGEYCELISLL